MKTVAEAEVATIHAVKYSAQLGKHWAHNLHVEEVGDTRLVTFPRNARGADWAADALVVFKPEEGNLRIRIEASEPDQRDGLKGAVERHLDRFAFREAPLTYDWRDILEGDKE